MIAISNDISTLFDVIDTMNQNYEDLYKLVDEKADREHTHETSEIDDLNVAFDKKAENDHTHYKVI